MSLLVWNYRGPGNLRIEDQLVDFVWAKDPFVVFLAETWTDKARPEQVQNGRRVDHFMERRISLGSCQVFKELY